MIHNLFQIETRMLEQKKYYTTKKKIILPKVFTMSVSKEFVPNNWNIIIFKNISHQH